MKSRVTITLDPDVHARAKHAARARRTTVSGLIESFLRSPAASPTGLDDGRSLVDEMLGSAEVRESPPGRDLVFDALHARLIATESRAAPRARRHR